MPLHIPLPNLSVRPLRQLSDMLQRIAPLVGEAMAFVQPFSEAVQLCKYNIQVMWQN